MTISDYLDSKLSTVSHFDDYSDGYFDFYFPTGESVVINENNGSAMAHLCFHLDSYSGMVRYYIKPTAYVYDEENQCNYLENYTGETFKQLKSACYKAMVFVKDVEKEFDVSFSLQDVNDPEPFLYANRFLLKLYEE